METMINLTDLLKHEILDLYSVEEQIIEALPKMVEKAKNPELKKALRDHLKVTEEHKSRLDKVKQAFGEGNGQGENKGFFSRLFGGGSGGEKCKGMEGIISEGEKIMKADITDEALDAAIIASAQKVEHYEICGYGTARAFARELKLAEVEQLLTKTLNEEYAADDLLTSLAVGKLNIEAEQANGMDNGKNKNVVPANGISKAPGEKKPSKSSSRSNGTKSIVSSSKSKTNSSASKSAKSSAGSGASKSNSGSKGAGKSAGARSSTSSRTGSALSANRGSSKSVSKGISKSLAKSTSSNGKGRGNGSSKIKRATSGGQRQR